MKESKNCAMKHSSTRQSFLDTLQLTRSATYCWGVTHIHHGGSCVRTGTWRSWRVPTRGFCFLLNHSRTGCQRSSARRWLEIDGLQRAAQNCQQRVSAEHLLWIVCRACNAVDLYVGKLATSHDGAVKLMQSLDGIASSKVL